MQRSARQQVTSVLAFLFAAAPFGVGLLRIVSADDLRYMWMAIAAFLGAALVIVLGSVRSRRVTVVLVFLAFVIATLLAAGTGFLLGASAGIGLFLVSVVIGLFSATSHVLYALSRVR